MGDQRHAKMRAVEKTHGEMIGSKASGPFERLPPALAAGVLSWLSVPDHIFRAALVSKHWLALARHPLSWEFVDFDTETSQRFLANGIPPAEWIERWSFRPLALRILVWRAASARERLLFVTSVAANLRALLVRLGPEVAHDSEAATLQLLRAPALTSLTVHAPPRAFAVDKQRLPALQRLTLVACEEEPHASVAPYLVRFEGELGAPGAASPAFLASCPLLRRLDARITSRTPLNRLAPLLRELAEHKLPVRTLQLPLHAFAGEQAPAFPPRLFPDPPPGIDYGDLVAGAAAADAEAKRKQSAAEETPVADAAALVALLARLSPGLQELTLVDVFGRLPYFAPQQQPLLSFLPALTGRCVPRLVLTDVVLAPAACLALMSAECAHLTGGGGGNVAFHDCLIDMYAHDVSNCYRPRHSSACHARFIDQLQRTPEQRAAFARVFGPSGVTAGCPGCRKPWDAPEQWTCPGVILNNMPWHIYSAVYGPPSVSPVASAVQQSESSFGSA